MKSTSRRVVLVGATGAVGGHVAAHLLDMPGVERLTILGRRSAGLSSPKVVEHLIDVLDASSYQEFLTDHDTAICTLGVGEPSKMSREAFVRIDKDAVFAFASGCRDAGVRHFSLLGSVGADAKSRTFYLRCKGELEDDLRALAFERLSLFHPSMILTPTNRYGLSQAITLKVWPSLGAVLMGSARKLRGIEVAKLGRAMAMNTSDDSTGEETLWWDDFHRILGAS